MTDAAREPERIPAGSVDPSEPGQPWWKYRPMQLPAAMRAPANGDDGARADTRPPAAVQSDEDIEEEGGTRRRGADLIQTHASSGVGAFALGALILATVGIATQLGATREGPWLVPIGAVFLAVAASQQIQRRHPDEPWVGRLLLLGTLLKIAAAYARYFNLETNYNGVGDASDYDKVGRQYASSWLHGTPAPVLTDLRKTNFVRWFTGVVYYIFGSNLMTGTFVFALLALIGTYFWYRATADAVPIIDKRLYMMLVLFAPSIAFWPAIIGKEALMQLGLGTLALGASLMFRRKLVLGLLVGLPGGWLTWVVRPHLLAMVVIATAVAYFAGRVGARGWGLLSRPAGILVMGFLVAFTVTQAASFLGLNSISLKSVQSELDQTTAQTAQGGSQFAQGSTNSLNPVNLPKDVATVFIRPFPWEAHGLQLLAAAEGLALAGAIIVRFKSMKVSLARAREFPYLMFAWVLVLLYSITFASFANFGILVRQRSLVLPAILILIAVDPALDRARRGEDPEPRHAVIGTT